VLWVWNKKKIAGAPRGGAAFVCLEKQTEIYEKGGME